MMNPSPPPASNDPNITAIISLLHAMRDPDAAAKRLDELVAKDRDTAAGAAQLQSAQQKFADDIKAANTALDAAKSAHASAALKRETALNVAAAAQREKSLDKREAELDSRAKVLDDRHAAITKREAAFVQAQRLMAI